MGQVKRVLEYGGYAAAVVLIAFGIGALVLSIDGKSTVKDDLGQEKIVGSSDMTPDAIAAEAKEAGLSGVDFPGCSVAGKTVDTGSEARCFASYMRIHALEATGGKTYAEMPRFATADGKGTNDAAQEQEGRERPAGCERRARDLGRKPHSRRRSTPPTWPTNSATSASSSGSR